MKQSLQLKLSQNLALTPQLQQAIRLLQLSSLELEEEVERVLRENPFLERIEPESEENWSKDFAGELSNSSVSQGEASDIEADSTHHNDDAREYSPSEDGGDLGSFGEQQEWGHGTNQREGDENDYEASGDPRLVNPISLHRHLRWQLQLSQQTPRDQAIIEVLIDAIDDNGYLTASLEELQTVFPVELEVHLEDIQVGLVYLQSFEPTGVGARDAAECLGLQIQALPESLPYRQEALILVKQHLPLLAHKDYLKLRRLLHCDEATLKGAEELIRKLNPKPGANYNTLETKYIVADVIVRRIKDEWTTQLNEAAVPRLRLNQMYSSILNRHRESSLQQLRGHLQEAKWIIKNIHQRYETILRVAQAIVERQKAFFDYGEIAMRPLVLQEIADQLELHESTISRVTSQKYMLTPRGVFELKYFFGSHVATDTGGVASATAIRALIRQVIDQENQRKPISDNKIAELLKEQGIIVARRTIAKYREALQIAPAHLRKSL